MQRQLSPAGIPMTPLGSVTRGHGFSTCVAKPFCPSDLVQTPQAQINVRLSRQL